MEEKGNTLMKKDLFINGKWKKAARYQSVISPYSEEEIGVVPSANEEEVNEAIQAAERATTEMAQLPAHKRAAIIEKLAEKLEQKKEEAASLIAMEAAKPIATAREEVARTIQTYKFSAEEAKRIHGETLALDAAPGGENRLAFTVREPIGVIGAITPFNFPMNLVAHKVGPAIASGNTIVLKPASQTPLSAYFLAELLEVTDLPAGAFNVVTGSGRTVGDQLVTDPRLAAITFTGSPSVGFEIRNKAGLKRVTLELGSNSAVIIDQGTDLDKVIARCVKGAYSFQGQVCISVQRIYVHESLYESFVERFVEETGKLQTGDPLDPKTDISALISKKDVIRSLSWIKEAEQHGAEVVIGGKAEGNILYPTVILNADPSLKVSCQEAFAPIAVINRFKTVEEAIGQVNNSRYGLQAGIYTDKMQHALLAAQKLRVGGVMINDIPTFRVDHMPYGGVKDSGMGREGIKYAIREMTELKLVVFHQYEK